MPRSVAIAGRAVEVGAALAEKRLVLAMVRAVALLPAFRGPPASGVRTGTGCCPAVTARGGQPALASPRCTTGQLLQLRFLQYCPEIFQLYTYIRHADGVVQEGEMVSRGISLGEWCSWH